MPLTPDMRRAIDQIRDYLFGGGYPDPLSNGEQLSSVRACAAADQAGRRVGPVPHAAVGDPHHRDARPQGRRGHLRPGRGHRGLSGGCLQPRPPGELVSLSGLADDVQVAFGFFEPRICVKVKSRQSPIERTEIDALGGVVKKVDATHGLRVCRGGFKSSMDCDETQQFFHVRLWGADDVIDELLGVYDRLDVDLRALIPLKRVWTLSASDES